MHICEAPWNVMAEPKRAGGCGPEGSTKAKLYSVDSGEKLATQRLFVSMVSEDSVGANPPNM